MIKPLKPLTGPAAHIWRATMAAMQDAEEIWGCHNPEDYLGLMESIAAEACQRIVNARHTFGMPPDSMVRNLEPYLGHQADYMLVKINPEGT